MVDHEHPQVIWSRSMRSLRDHREAHPNSSSSRPRSSAKPFSVRIDSAWNCTPRKFGPATRCTSPVAGSASDASPRETVLRRPGRRRCCRSRRAPRARRSHRRLGALEDDVLVGKGNPEPCRTAPGGPRQTARKGLPEASRLSIASAVGRDLRVFVLARVTGAGADHDQVDVVEDALGSVLEQRLVADHPRAHAEHREHVRQHVHEVVLAVQDRDRPARQRSGPAAPRPGRSARTSRAAGCASSGRSARPRPG